MDKRFEAIDKRFEELIDFMNKRFEAVDKRFEDLIATMKTGFEDVKHYVDESFSEVATRYGSQVETAVRKTAQELFKVKGFDPDQIKYLQVKDVTGKFLGKANYLTDIDLFYTNSETWIIEIKSRPVEGDLIKINQVKQLLEHDYKINITRTILIALSLSEEVKTEAENLDIEIWHATKERPHLELPT